MPSSGLESWPHLGAFAAGIAFKTILFGALNARLFFVSDEPDVHRVVRLTNPAATCPQGFTWLYEVSK